MEKSVGYLVLVLFARLNGREGKGREEEKRKCCCRRPLLAKGALLPSLLLPLTFIFFTHAAAYVHT